MISSTLFSSLIGNEEVKKYLSAIIQRGTIGNSLLFAGPEGVGKSLFAKTLARALLTKDSVSQEKFDAGSHPDFHVFRPEGKIGMHSIQSMRELTEKVYQHPYEAPYSVFLIHEADRMLTYSANALLKTFEEPAPKSVIILLSHAPQKLLPTVLSRCRTIHFQAIAEEMIQKWLLTHGAQSEDAELLARRARGSLGAALRLYKEGSAQVREQLLVLFGQPKLTHYQEVMQAAAAIASLVDTAKKEIEEAARKEQSAKGTEQLSALQKEEIEREIEGAIAMRQTAEAQSLFDAILSWYRDLWLLHTAGNQTFLLNPEYKHQLEQAYQRGELLPLQRVQEVISQSKLALERSTSLQIVLEGLFLQFRLVAFGK